MKITRVGLFVLFAIILGTSGASLATERKTPSAPEDVLKMRNPVPLTIETLQEAADIYTA